MKREYKPEVQAEITLILLKARRFPTSNFTMYKAIIFSLLPDFLKYKPQLVLPIVAKSLFIKEFKLENNSLWKQNKLYKEQCIIKTKKGISANIYNIL